jgi:4-hydroxybenzoate polyprenyltransferase
MWVNIIGGIYILSAMAVVLFVPHQIRGDIFLPGFLILCGGIVYKNRRLSKIRREEQAR